MVEAWPSFLPTRYNPGVLQQHKWENAMTVDRRSWGHRRNMRIEDVLGMEELLATLVTTISCGGNLLLNVGPSSDGTIEPIFQERLRQVRGRGARLPAGRLARSQRRGGLRLGALGRAE
jgi:alpha-L-fucosidase